MKRVFLFFFLLVLAIAATDFLMSGKHADLYDETRPCPFCSSEVVERQKVYEDEWVLVLYNYRPIMPGHCMVLPKRHVQRFEELTPEEFLAVAQAVQKTHEAVVRAYDTSAYLLLQKNGAEVGQTVPHVHFHYVPRKAGEYSNILFLSKFYLNIFLPPLKERELEEAVQRIRKAWLKEVENS